MSVGLGVENFTVDATQAIFQFLDIGILVVNILLLVWLAGLLGEILEDCL
jgi:hypothetical protein